MVSQIWKPSLAFIFATLLFLSGCKEEFPQTYTYSSTYEVEFDLPTVMQRFGQLNHEAEFKNPVLGTDYERANHFGDFQGERLYYRHLGETTRFDTVKVKDQNGDTIPGDPYDLVEKRTVKLDTHYLSPDNYFTYYFWPEDPKGCFEIRALIRLEEKGNQSIIHLEKVRVGDCGVDMETDDKSMKDFIEATFEERVINPIKG